MAYIEGYTYDIFISYSHIDNEKSSGQTTSWIEQFYKDLNVLLWQSIGTRDIKIWWDNKRLDGGIFFDDAIEKGINESAIFLCLNSPSFLHSDYCQKELDLFYNKAQHDSFGLKVDDRSRIINVLLYNIPYTNWPYELSGTTGFRFHKQVEEDDQGDPIDVQDAQYKIQLHSLRDALVALIEILKNPPPPPPSTFTVFFGDVSDALAGVKKKAIAELEKEGYKVIRGIPPPYEDDEHEKAVTKELENSSLSIHLLDQYPGREIMGEETAWYPQKQVELGLKSDTPKLIWVPGQTDINSIEEEQYKTFMNGLDSGKQSGKNVEYIRGSKSELNQQIKDLIAKIVKETAPPAMNGQLSVLLDTHYKDQLYALELSKSLLEKEIQPFINPQEDDPRKNINILEDRISQVSKLIFFYGKVSKDWVVERMNAALQLIVANNYAIDDFFVFMVPPHKDTNEISLKQRFLKLNVFNFSDKPSIDTNALDDFFNNLRS